MKKLNKLKQLTSLFILSSACLSCNFETLFEPTFNDPVKEYFDTYTNTAGIEDNKLSVKSYNDSSARLCIDSSTQCEMTLYLRNPQLYTLVPSVEFKSLSDIDTSKVTITQTSTETILLTLPEGFLADSDEGQNISPSVKLYEPMSGRNFETYSTSLYCNSKPPELNNATVLNNNNKTFIIAFDMPSQAELALRHKDLCQITIINEAGNSVTKNISISDDGKFSFDDSAFTTTAETYQAISGKSFTHTDRSVYYETNETFETSDKEYTIVLTDTAGLTSKTLASTKITKLVCPGLLNASEEDVSGSSYTVPFLTGKEYNEVTITVPLKDHLDNDVPAEGTTVHYNLYNGTPQVARLYQSGTFDGSESSKTLQLEVGTWYIETYATKVNYEKSAVTTVSVRVVDSNLYINESGDDSTADGTKALPYKTFDAAVEDLKSRTDPGLDYSLIIIGTIDGGILDTDFTANSLYIGTGTDSGTIERLTVKSATPLSIVNLTITNLTLENTANISIENVTIDKLTLKDTANVSLKTGTSVTEATVEGTATASITDDVQITTATVEANATLSIKDAVQITTANLKENAKLTIAGNLTAEIPATITPEKYVQGRQVLAETENGLITANWKKFTLTQKESSSTAWIIIHDGTLKEVTKLKTPDFTDSDGNLITDSYITRTHLENQEYNTITLAPPSQDVPGSTVETEGTTVYYKLYKGTKNHEVLSESGSFTCSSAVPSKTFELTTGTWRLEAYAERIVNGIRYYADSDTLSRTVRIIDSDIYISSNGSDETDDGDGTSATPFATLAKAVEDINERNTSSVSYNLHITGSISGTTVSENLKAAALNITNYGTASVETLTIQTATPVSIANLTITNLTLENAANVSLKSGTSVTEATVEGTATASITDDVQITTATVEANATLSIKDAAQIENAILSNNAKLTIAGELTASTTAKITPQTYANGIQVLDRSAEHIAANYNHFTVTQNNEDTAWGITNEGKLIEKAIRNITISVIEQESDIAVSQSKSGNTVTLTASAGYTDYVWEVLGDSLTGTENSENVFTADVTNWAKGYYDIYLTAKKNGKTYSAHTQITIGE